MRRSQIAMLTLIVSLSISIHYDRTGAYGFSAHDSSWSLFSPTSKIREGFSRERHSLLTTSKFSRWACESRSYPKEACRESKLSHYIIEDILFLLLYSVGKTSVIILKLLCMIACHDLCGCYHFDLKLTTRAVWIFPSIFSWVLNVISSQESQQF